MYHARTELAPYAQRPAQRRHWSVLAPGRGEGRTTGMSAATEWEPDRANLTALAETYKAQFHGADPFPHVIIDDFLPADVLHDVIDAYPGPDDATWGEFNTLREIKLALNDDTRMPRPVRNVLQQLNTQVALDFLETLTGISGLVADPHFTGGGLHQIRPGGVLKVHADFNIHRRLNLHRRLNAILYLNQDWEDSYGGHLELWDLEMTRAVQRVAPIANRLVVFETGETSWHGHPDPLTCPVDRTRRSMAWYYYTALSSAPTRSHTTRFQARPGETIRSPKDHIDHLVEQAKDRIRPLRDGFSKSSR
jgi:Rps23 Pro-64 3,4-dihydroxylase Tpa1-like proline 4-hydroxylase